ncbi:transposase [Mucilaginibacter sp.]|uniref:transposase n=1 Tax=Mucilaginibacter sp. TaxID=1882438 RepID=UPI003AFF9297
MKKRVYDVEFKKMAVELSDAKGSVKEAAEELDIDPGRISNWRNHYKSAHTSTASISNLSAEQKEIRRLQKELREAQQERDILKKRSASFPGETGSIQIYKGQTD